MPNPHRSPSVCDVTRNARAYASVHRMGANSWIASSVDITFLNTVQSALLNGMKAMPPLPLHSTSNIASKRNAHIFLLSMVGYAGPISYTERTPLGSTDHVPVPVEADGHNPVRGTFVSISNERSTGERRTISMWVALRCFDGREERPACAPQVQLHLVDRVTPPENARFMSVHSVTPSSFHVKGATIRAS